MGGVLADLLATWVIGYRVPGNPAEQAELHGADMEVPDWASRLICSPCGSRNTDFVVAPDSTGGLGKR